MRVRVNCNRCISPAFYTVLVSALTGMCYAVPKTSGRLRYEADAILRQHFDDSGFVWLWFIWQQLLLWCLDAGICSAWMYHSRCDHCPVYAALSVLPPLSRYDVLFRKENILSALRQRCARGQKRLTAPSFSAMLDASNMRKRGYHEAWSVPDAGHGIAAGESRGHAPLCARCNCGRL